MSTENQQTDQLPPKDFSEPDSNLQNPQECEHPEQPQKKEFIPDTIDHIKNMIQPLNDNISDINLMFENGEFVSNEEEKEEQNIQTKETVTRIITTKTTTTKTTKIINNGKETSTTQTTVEEKSESKVGQSRANIIIKTVINNDKQQK